VKRRSASSRHLLAVAEAAQQFARVNRAFALVDTDAQPEKNARERRMAKAPPSAKRDRIKAFTTALVDYSNDVVYGGA
jgi:hypothetical protein